MKIFSYLMFIFVFYAWPTSVHGQELGPSHLANMKASYDNNQARFKRDYIGKKFKGTLPFRDATDIFNTGTYRVQFGTGGWTGDVDCKVGDRTRLDQVIEFNKGDMVTISGVIDDMMMGSLQLGNCRFNEPELTTNIDRYITILTDTLDLTIDLVGGDVIRADLVKYPATKSTNDPYELLKPDIARLHIAQSGLVGKAGPDSNPKGRPLYSSPQKSYTLDGDTLLVPLTWSSAEGFSMTKTFAFKRDKHVIDVSYDIRNSTSSRVTLAQFAQFKQTTAYQAGGIYRSGAYSWLDDKCEKIAFSDFENEKLNISATGGWAATIEPDFVAAWVPPQRQTNTITSRIVDNYFAIIGYIGSPVTIAVNAESKISSQLYIGPRTQSALSYLGCK